MKICHTKAPLGKAIIGIFLLLILPIESAEAAGPDWALTTSIASHHFNRSHSWCEKNPGLGLQKYYSDRSYLTVGFYRNSYCDTSVYLLAGIETDTSKALGLGIMGGAIFGYKRSEGHALAPLEAVPYIRVGSKYSVVQAKVWAWPASHGLVALQLNWRL